VTGTNAGSGANPTIGFTIGFNLFQGHFTALERTLRLEQSSCRVELALHKKSELLHTPRISSEFLSH